MRVVQAKWHEKIPTQSGSNGRLGGRKYLKRCHFFHCDFNSILNPNSFFFLQISGCVAALHAIPLHHVPFPCVASHTPALYAIPHTHALCFHSGKSANIQTKSLAHVTLDFIGWMDGHKCTKFDKIQLLSDLLGSSVIHIHHHFSPFSVCFYCVVYSHLTGDGICNIIWWTIWAVQWNLSCTVYSCKCWDTQTGIDLC